MKSKSKIITKDFWVKQNFFKELTKFEHCVLWISLAIILVIFILDVIPNYSKQSPYLTFAASLLNAFSVVSCIKKKPISPFLCTIASLILAPVAWVEKTFANMMMYQISAISSLVSFFTWAKHTDNTASIKPRSAKWWQILVYCVGIVALITSFTFVEGLQSYQDFMTQTKHASIPAWYSRMFDSACLMLTVALFVPEVLRMKYVPHIYITLNCCQIATWISKLVEFMNAGEYNQAMNACMMMVSTISFLIMNIIGLVAWTRPTKKLSKTK